MVEDFPGVEFRFNDRQLNECVSCGAEVLLHHIEYPGQFTLHFQAAISAQTIIVVSAAMVFKHSQVLKTPL